MDRKHFLLATPALLGLAAGGFWSACTSQNEETRQPEKSIPPMEPVPPVIGRSSVAYDASGAVATLSVASGNLRIMQFTDLHFFNKSEQRGVFNAKDMQTIEDLKAFVRIYNPDFIMVTGDTWHDNPDGFGFEMMRQALDTLSALNRPFGFVWGNHDQMDDYQAGHDYIAALPNSLYRGAATHGDYRIRVVDTRTGERLAGTLYCMNSHQHGLLPWQLNWLESAAGEQRETQTPALAFFHIPVLEQKSLYDANLIPGVQGEDVCNEKEHGLATPVLAQRPVKATFCGHDHVNDYMVSADTVDLHYGRATGHSGYGGDSVRKGAKMIDWNLDNGSYRAQTVFADGTQWIFHRS